MAVVDLVLYEAKENIARITLNRPEKRNALNAELMTRLQQALERAEADQAVRIILIMGAGKDFCAGLDLSALDQGSDANAIEHLNTARRVANLLLAIRRHRCPVIAAVHGRALGGGAGIACASDLILAAQSAALGYPEVNIGFVPAIVAALLQRSVTEKRAFEYLVSGNQIPAPEAQSVGLVNRVFPDEEFAPGVEAYARNLAGKSSTSLSLTKRLLYHTDGMTLEQAIESGVQMNAFSRSTEDAKRGFASFSKK